MSTALEPPSRKRKLPDPCDVFKCSDLAYSFVRDQFKKRPKHSWQHKPECLFNPMFKPISTSKTFHLFPLLPPELRLMVWGFALEGRDICLTDWMIQQTEHGPPSDVVRRDHDIMVPSILHVNAEARTFALKHYEVVNGEEMMWEQRVRKYAAEGRLPPSRREQPFRRNEHGECPYRSEVRPTRFYYCADIDNAADAMTLITRRRKMVDELAKAFRQSRWD